MGMDVYGEAPSSEAGDYFRANVWHWHPLWDFVCESTNGTLTEEDADIGHTNSGHVIDAAKATAIADRLDTLIASGAVKAYRLAYDAEHAAMPDVTCDLCKGAGHRTREEMQSIRVDWSAAELAKLTAPGGCNACGGKGTVRPWETHYPFEEETVREFAAFARASGGFRIS